MEMYHMMNHHDFWNVSVGFMACSKTTLSMACLQTLSAVDRLWCGFGLIHQNNPAEVSWIAMRCGLWWV